MADERPPPTLVVVLAAGGGTRFTGPGHKLDATIGGRSIADVAVGAAVDAAIGPVVVVTGAIAPTVTSGPIEPVHNPDWSEGQSTSLQVAVAEARRRDAEAIVVGLADQPFVPPEAWRLVAASTSPIAVATYQGRRRNPVRLHRSVWDLLPTEGDIGAREVARVRPTLVEEIPCPGSPDDIDTLEDLRTWQSRSSTNSP